MTKHLVTAAAVLSAAVFVLARSASAGDAPAAPEFAGITAWVNSEPLTLKGLKGKVVLVHFWTHGCVNCVHNYPPLKRLHERFAGKNVVLVGVHTPEFETEKAVERVKAAADKNGLKYAIAVDNDSKTWRAWGNRYWPAVYVVDRAGKVRGKWEGELNFNGNDGEAQVRAKVEELLGEK